ncbi:MAG: hypothetical protein GX348_04920 [Veillonellaceae bacterium]|jgi:hypothetical protein|nr:hypothetical protein [Veillonellaceae bacterium]
MGHANNKEKSKHPGNATTDEKRKDGSTSMPPVRSARCGDDKLIIVFNEKLVEHLMLMKK